MYKSKQKYSTLSKPVVLCLFVFACLLQAAPGEETKAIKMVSTDVKASKTLENKIERPRIISMTVVIEKKGEKIKKKINTREFSALFWNEDSIKILAYYYGNGCSNKSAITPEFIARNFGKKRVKHLLKKCLHVIENGKEVFYITSDFIWAIWKLHTNPFDYAGLLKLPSCRPIGL